MTLTARLALLLLLLAPACALAQFTAIPPGATLDQVLDALHVRGQDMRDFSANVTVASVDQTTGDSSSQIGQVVFQKLGDDDGRIRVNFTQRTEGTRVIDEHHEYTLSGGWLTERDYGKKTEVRRQVVAPGQKINLLKLGEGPFPLPIGQAPQDVRDQFDVTLSPPDKSDPPDTVHVMLKPKDHTELSRRYSQIDVWYDRKTGMPVQIQTQDQAGQQLITTNLSNTQLNVGAKDSDFELPSVDGQGWDETSEPWRG